MGLGSTTAALLVQRHILSLELFDFTELGLNLCCEGIKQKITPHWIARSSSVALQQDLPLQLKIRRRKIGEKKPPCLHWKDLWKRKTVTHLVFGLPVPPSIRPSCKTRPLCLSVSDIRRRHLVNSSSTFLFFFFSLPPSWPPKKLQT